jgi:murein DD-endopeptidase MepM/ murein hydrolase activator NlpD
MRSRAAGHRATVLFLLGLAFFSENGGSLALPASQASPAKGTQPSPRETRKKAGVYHRLERGQTLSILSQGYRVPVATLMEVNGIRDPERIPALTPIFVPGATRRLSLPTDGEPIFDWPLEGKITTRFCLEGKCRHHEGIDIDGNLGDPIRTAAEGRILLAEREGRYGKAVLIDHGGGLNTFYAHASKLLVHAGEWVEKGQVIAEVGMSGNARGSHLHFETHLDGRPQNPVRFLPRTLEARRR